MGILDKIFGGKKDHDAHAGHEHLDCECGKHFHTRAEYDEHRRTVHAGK